MPIQHAIWKVGDNPQPLAASQLVSEQKLEEMIVRDPRILSSEWMLIGRQEITSHGGRIDLMAVAEQRRIVAKVDGTVLSTEISPHIRQSVTAETGGCGGRAGRYLNSN